MIEPFQRCRILTGPTASGKSALAIQLAEELNGELLSADSMTIYRGMDIGTAKPSMADQARVRHHLIDELEPHESASVAWWLARAEKCVKDIEERGKIAIFVGGTPLYLKALLCGLFDGPPRDALVRQRLEIEASEIGNIAFHSKLTAVDPVSAARLHPNDIRRVVRAMEVFEISGKPLGDWQQQGWWGEEEPAFGENVCFALELPRPVLYDRINHRVQQMFDAGWADEVRRLAANPTGWSKEARKALGYQEMLQYLNHERALDETLGEIQLRTRQFAKRQLTWFRGLAGIQFVNPVDALGILRQRWTTH